MSAEEYKGVKFRTGFDSKNELKDADIEELAKWCEEFSRNNLTPEYENGSAGNLSYRCRANTEHFIITSTGLRSKNLLSAVSNQLSANFVKVTSCDVEKMIVYAEGLKEPSSESIMHYTIYRHRKDINAIFHGHSEDIMNNYAKLNIPSTAKPAPYGSKKLIDTILELINREEFSTNYELRTKNFFIIKEHGFVSLGRSMTEAGKQAFEILKRCK